MQTIIPAHLILKYKTPFIISNISESSEVKDFLLTDYKNFKIYQNEFKSDDFNVINFANQLQAHEKNLISFYKDHGLYNIQNNLVLLTNNNIDDSTVNFISNFAKENFLKNVVYIFGKKNVNGDAYFFGHKSSSSFIFVGDYVVLLKFCRLESSLLHNVAFLKEHEMFISENKKENLKLFINTFCSLYGINFSEPIYA